MSPYPRRTDPLWAAVDTYTASHLHSRSPSLNDALDHAVKSSNDNGLPTMSVSAVQGKFLMLQCRSLGVKHVLEVGTLGGYSAIWMANASPDIKITTVEVNEKHAAVSRENLRYAGLSERTEIILGKGVDVLPKLVEEVNQGKRERFGLMFIDADKVNNWTYYDLAANMCAPRAYLIVDNVVRQGSLSDGEFAKTDVGVEGNRRLVENVGQDERADAVVMQTVGGKFYDGFLIAVARDDIVEYVKGKAA